MLISRSEIDEDKTNDDLLRHLASIQAAVVEDSRFGVSVAEASETATAEATRDGRPRKYPEETTASQSAKW